MDFYNKTTQNIKKDSFEILKNVVDVIIAELSPNPVQFIFEILQNAEDTNATKACFNLYEDRIEYLHNGKIFDENDVQAISSVAMGTKKDSDKIGKFGIGFKSVFVYTQSPQIFSGDYSFEIPLIGCNSIEKREIEKGYTTLIKIPFNRKQISKKECYTTIAEALKKLDYECNIFLDSISCVEINIYDELEVNYNKIISKEIKENKKIEDGNEIEKIEYEIYPDTKYLIFKKQINKHEMNKKPKYVKIAYKLKATDEGMSFLYDLNNKIFVSFPTSIESGLNFMVHAPLNTTPARDNIKIGENTYEGKFNIHLYDQVAKLACDSYLYLKNEHLLDMKFISKFTPMSKLTSNEEINNLLYNKVYDAIVVMFKTKKIIPTFERQFEFKDNILIPEGVYLTKLFSNQDLTIILNKTYSWVQDIDNKDYFENIVGIEKYSLDKLIEDASKEFLLNKDDEFLIEILKRCKYTKFNDIFHAQFLENKLDDFIIKIYEVLIDRSGKECKYDYVKRKSVDPVINLVKNLPVIRCEDGKHIKPFAHNIPNVYINNPNHKLKIKDSILDSEISKEFLKKIGVNEYDIFKELEDEILPKYVPNNNKLSFNTDDPLNENFNDLKKVQEAFKKNERRVYELIKDKFLLNCTENKTDKIYWCKPSNVYFNNSFGDIYKDNNVYFDEKSDIYYLAKEYKDEFNIEFLKKMGVNEKPQYIEVNDYDGKDYSERAYKELCISNRGDAAFRSLYSKILCKSYKKMICNYSYDKFYRFYDYIDGIYEAITAINIDKSIVLAKVFTEYVSKFHSRLKVKLTGANDQNYNGANVDHLNEVPSFLGICILYTPWISSNDGRFFRINEIKRKDIHPVYEEIAKSLLDLLNNYFKSDIAKNAIAYLVKNDNRIVKYKDEFENLLNNPERLERLLNLEKDIIEIENREYLKRKRLEKIRDEQARGYIAAALANRNIQGIDEELMDDLFEDNFYDDEYEFADSDYGKSSNPEFRIKGVRERIIEENKNNFDTSFRIKSIKTWQNEYKKKHREYLKVLYKDRDRNKKCNCQICQSYIEKKNGDYFFTASHLIYVDEVPEGLYSANGLTLCLCANCAAKLRVGKVEKVNEFLDKAKNYTTGKSLELPLRVCGEDIKIKYAEKHMLDLKAALLSDEDAK